MATPAGSIHLNDLPSLSVGDPWRIITTHFESGVTTLTPLPSQHSPWPTLAAHSAYRWSRSPHRCPPAARTDQRTWPSRRASRAKKMERKESVLHPHVNTQRANHQSIEYIHEPLQPAAWPLSTLLASVLFRFVSAIQICMVL